MTTRQLASNLLGTRIDEGKWIETIDFLDRSGRMDAKKVMRLAILACMKVEELEQRLETTLQSTK